MLVVFWWKRGRLTWKGDVLPLLPLFLVGAGVGIFTAWVELYVAGAEGSEFAFPALERCMLASRVAWFYLGKLFWPTDLIFMYPRWQVSRAITWQYLPPLAVIAVLAVLWLLRCRTRAPLAAALFFLGTLFPVAGFLNLYVFRYSLVADHFQYLPSLGIITLFSAGVAMLLKRAGGWGRSFGKMGCVALVVVLAVLTWRQSRMYADIDTLYGTTIERNPGCWMAHNNFGEVLAGRGQYREAITHYRKAIEIKPDYLDARYNLANNLAKSGRIDEAIAHYQKILEIKADYVEAHNNLGLVLADRGQADEAIAHYRKALEIKPDLAEAHNNLGTALAGRGQVDEAIAHYRQALEIQPDYIPALMNLGNSLNGLGQVGQALKQYQKALGLASAGNDRALADAIRAQIRLCQPVIAPAGNE
jgi:tetratricopeptide (TPR) repeat protein